IWGDLFSPVIKRRLNKMTNEKKTTTTKKSVPAKKTEVKKVEAVEEVITPEEKPKTENKPTVKKFDKHDDVLIMNNTTGRYGYISRSGFAMEMSEYGDTLTIPF